MATKAKAKWNYRSKTAKKAPQRKHSPQRMKAVGWIALNRGRLAEIAAEQGVTPQFAHYILYGERKSKDGRIERALRAAGAPL